MKEIVIKIDDARFKDIQRIAEVQLNKRTDTVEQLIAKGTELPKGHTELIDAKALIQDFCMAEENMKGNGITPVFDVHEIINMILSQEVIIEADKEYKVEAITRGKCMICGKELTEGLFFCKECEGKVEADKEE